jgi:hypothetical protein
MYSFTFSLTSAEMGVGDYLYALAALLKERNTGPI